MKIINSHSINTPEHYNMLFGNKGFKINQKGPRRAELLLSRFTGGKFLDVGCGLAPHSEMAARVPNSDVHAMDFSDKLIENLRVRFPHIKYVVGDVMKIPFDDNTFDYAVLGEVLEHMDDPAATIKEVTRILKVGGILAMSVPMHDGGSRSRKEHKWSFLEQDIYDLLSPHGKTEICPLKQGYRSYIIGYLTKC